MKTLTKDVAICLVVFIAYVVGFMVAERSRTVDYPLYSAACSVVMRFKPEAKNFSHEFMDYFKNAPDFWVRFGQFKQLQEDACAYQLVKDNTAPLAFVVRDR